MNAARIRLVVPRPARRAPRVLVAAVAAMVSTSALANTYTVSTTADAGIGSLRQAILDANAQQSTGGTQCAGHTITFAIPGSGPHAIHPLSPLPKINIPIAFEGYSQPGSSENTAVTGSNAVIAIELDGSLAGPTDAFVVGAGIPGSGLCSGNTSTFRGLVINRFAGAAISMGEETCPAGEACLNGGVLIQGNYIGTDVTGTQALGNGIALARPALVFGTSSRVNIVGDQVVSNGGPVDPRPQSRNVIAGNGADAIRIFSTSADTNTGLSQGHVIRNNYIGLDATGAAALPNAGRGITMDANSGNVQIVDNLISANAGDGVAVLDNPFPGTSLVGNGIGIGIAGQPFGNGGHGVLVANLATGVSVGGRLVFAPTAAAIANNAGAGVFVDGFAIVDAGNLSSAHNGGLALDLAPAGVNTNDDGDPDTGPNELLNRPTIIAAAPDVGSTTGHIDGLLEAVPNSTYEIRFFLNDTCDAGGSGGGQTPMPTTFVNVTTDALGHGSFVKITPFLPASRYVTAVARGFSTTAAVPALITSEFSNCRLIGDDVIFANGFD